MSSSKDFSDYEPSDEVKKIIAQIDTWNCQDIHELVEMILDLKELLGDDLDSVFPFDNLPEPLEWKDLAEELRDGSIWIWTWDVQGRALIGGDLSLVHSMPELKKNQISWRLTL